MAQTHARFQGEHVLDDRPHPLGTGARVHGDGTAHRTRNTYGKLKAGKAAGERLVHQARQDNTRAHRERDAVVCADHTRELAAEGYDRTAVAFVCHEQVGPLADDDPGDVLLGEHVERAAQRVVAVTHEEQVGLAADTVARMARQALLLDKVGVGGARERHDGVEEAHRV